MNGYLTNPCLDNCGAGARAMGLPTAAGLRIRAFYRLVGRGARADGRGRVTMTMGAPTDLCCRARVLRWSHELVFSGHNAGDFK